MSLSVTKNQCKYHHVEYLVTVQKRKVRFPSRRGQVSFKEDGRLRVIHWKAKKLLTEILTLLLNMFLRRWFDFMLNSIAIAHMKLYNKLGFPRGTIDIIEVA